MRFWAAVAVLWLLPGFSWAAALRHKPLPERVALGAGMAFAISGLLTLLLHLLPGPFPITAARLAYLLAAVAPVLLAPRTLRRTLHIPRAASWLVIVLPILVAALARLPDLGYSEFQGDEAVILRRAAQALSGDDEQLFLHQKGPVEILTPMSLWALTGSINEPQARAPFALAGLVAVAAVTLLGARWFNLRTGMLAGLLVAISGFLVAFARIVQYQSLVAAMGALSLLAFTAYRRRGKLSDLIIGAILLAYGLLAHYDAVLAAPAALWLAGQRLTAHRAMWRRELGRLALAGMAGVAVLAIFYAPFVANPNFARTFGYLSGERLGSDGPFYNNTGRVWVMSTFYNSTYYAAGLLLLLGAWILDALSALRTHHTSRNTQYAIRNTHHTSHLAHHIPSCLYFAIPFVFYLFLVFDPRTHVYTFYPGAALLAGAAAARVWDWVRARGRGIALLLAVASAGWYALCAGYIGLVFVGHTPEYKREWPAIKSALYPTTYQDLPLFGFFGFPYRAGWKAVEELYAQGVLTGAYNSNEEPEITTWYVRSGARTLCSQPDLYIIAEHVQDEIALDYQELERDYHLAAHITVAARPKIRIYRRNAQPPNTFAVEQFARAFDQKTTIAAQLPSHYSGAQTVGTNFGNVGRLLGYDSSDRVSPGEALAVTLYWQALAPTRRNYQVFTHLVVGDKLIAQHDGAPACALRPTSAWEPGQIIRDEHVIPIGQDAPSGKARLIVGMYELITQERLPLADRPGDALPIAEIDILPSLAP